MITLNFFLNVEETSLRESVLFHGDKRGQRLSCVMRSGFQYKRSTNSKGSILKPVEPAWPLTGPCRATCTANEWPPTRRVSNQAVVWSCHCPELPVLHHVHYAFSPILGESKTHAQKSHDKRITICLPLMCGDACKTWLLCTSPRACRSLDKLFARGEQDLGFRKVRN